MSPVPPPRNLDIYRLVMARGLKQTEVALAYGVSPVRICQIVRRVRTWVDQSVGDWLFPRQDDLRFYAALATAQIRIHEIDSDPEQVLITAPDWTYRREVRNAEAPGSTTATATTTNPLLSVPNLSANPLNSSASESEEPFAANPSEAKESPPEYIQEVGYRLAELLMLWQKNRRITAALKSWR